jgi:hypothetical protein
MGLFNHHSDSVMFQNPCPPGCETCCPLDIQLAYDPVTNILTLTYIYDNATVARTVSLTDLQEPLTIGLTFNPTTNIITLAGTYAGIPFSNTIDITHNHDLELILNGTTLELTGEHDGVQVVTSVDLSSIIPPISGFVPYTGAIANVDLGTYNLIADQLALNISPSGTLAIGSTQWNNTIGSSETMLKGGSVVLKNGVDLVARVVNKVTPNQTLTKAQYQAVRVSGAQGQRMAVDLAQANNDTNSADTIGLVCETIATNQEGFILCVGQIEEINTTGSLQGETWADGDVLYLSPTTAGAITKVKPTGSGHIVVIGYVEYAHAIHGKIYVKVMNGWELDELHDVNITTPQKGDTLEYNGTLWVNNGIVYTIELMDALTVDFYAPYDLKINTTTNIKNAPTITIQDDGVIYALTNTIAIGSKITVTASIAGVVNLNITKA